VSEDLTQGLRSRPRSTAFFASRAAPSITCGFEVFVQLVIAAITTEPSCSSISSPSSSAFAVCRCGRVAVATVATSGSTVCGPGSWNEVGSLAGNVSSTPLSIVPLP
jgi:hypothetical protein